MKYIFVIFLLIGLNIILRLIINRAAINAKKRKKTQDNILEEYGHNFDRNKCFRVRYASECRVHKMCKLFPWEATGILFLEEDKVICVMECDSGERVNLEFKREGTAIKWIGRKLWPYSISWFVLNLSGTNYYFTSETGRYVFGSKNTTEDIFEKLSKIFNQS